MKTKVTVHLPPGDSDGDEAPAGVLNKAVTSKADSLPRKVKSMKLGSKPGKTGTSLKAKGVGVVKAPGTKKTY